MPQKTKKNKNSHSSCLLLSLPGLASHSSLMPQKTKKQELTLFMPLALTSRPCLTQLSHASKNKKTRTPTLHASCSHFQALPHTALSCLKKQKNKNSHSSCLLLSL